LVTRIDKRLVITDRHRVALQAQKWKLKSKSEAESTKKLCWRWYHYPRSRLCITLSAFIVTRLRSSMWTSQGVGVKGLFGGSGGCKFDKRGQVLR
jgi:hypothetical protein